MLDCDVDCHFIRSKRVEYQQFHTVQSNIRGGKEEMSNLTIFSRLVSPATFAKGSQGQEVRRKLLH